MSISARLSATCWKQHRCLACRTVFRYLFNRRVVCRDRVPEVARQRARILLGRRLEEECDLVPCPNCGFVQPEMSGLRRARAHRWVTRLGVFVLAFLPTCRWSLIESCSCLALVTVLLNLLVAVWDPNLIPALNRWRSLRLRRLGRLMLMQRGSVESRRPRRSWRGALGALVVCALGWAILSNALWVSALLRWPVNVLCSPPVVGPGDQTRLSMGIFFAAGAGWTGKVDGDTPELRLTTRKEDLVAPTSFLSRLELPTPLWVQIRVADRTGLAYQRLTLQIDLKVTGYHQSLPTSKQEQIRLQLKLAQPHAGAVFQWVLWRAGLLVGFTLLMVGGQLLVFGGRDEAREGATSTLVALDDVSVSVEEQFRSAMQKL
jgi:hypothetical protein